MYLTAQRVDDDLEILASALRIVGLLSSALHSFKQSFVEPSVGSLGILLDHAFRLTAALTAESAGTLTRRDSGTLSPHGRASPIMGGPRKTASKPPAVLASVVETLLALVSSKRALVQIFKLQHCPTVMELCRSSHKQVRRGGGELLERLSTLNNSKIWLARTKLSSSPSVS